MWPTSPWLRRAALLGVVSLFLLAGEATARPDWKDWGDSWKAGGKDVQNLHEVEGMCPDARTAVRFYRGWTWRWQRAMSLPKMETEYVERRPHACELKRWAVDLWQDRAHDARKQYEHWADEQRRLAAAETDEGSSDYWVSKQIQAAEVIGRESAGDPWPNCPDPYDGSGASWSQTAMCENGGNWYDSPGYYRCGLQFDPAWERRFGRLCP